MQIRCCHVRHFGVDAGSDTYTIISIMHVWAWERFDFTDISLLTLLWANRFRFAGT
jgi:hypothetical protein